MVAVLGSALVLCAPPRGGAQTTPPPAEAPVAAPAAVPAPANTPETAKPPPSTEAVVPPPGTAAASPTAPAPASPAAAPAQAPPAPVPVRPVASPNASPEPVTATVEGPIATEGETGVRVLYKEYGAVAVLPYYRARLDLRKVPRNVQLVDPEVNRYRGVVGLADMLESRLSSVVLNDVQVNPLQPDLQYRGFTASPLLGSPQGISIYQNGVRLNEPFGDVMQWDLLPLLAIDAVQLTPGADPLYGLNSLGGSLVLTMKNGFSAEGVRVSAMGGSFARHRLSAEVGKAYDDWAFYGAASLFGERGFRKESQSSALNLFGDVRHRDTDGVLGTNLTFVSTELRGNALAPVELLDSEGRDAVFTCPDTTQNTLWMWATDVERRLDEHVRLQGTAYVRRMARDTINGDEGEFELCSEGDAVSVLCSEDGEPVFAERGLAIATDRAFNGLYNTTQTDTFGLGATGQLVVDAPLASRPNQFLVGLSADGARVDFLQRAEAAYLTEDRSVIGQGVYLAGDDYRTKLISTNRYLAAFIADTWTVADGLSLQLAGRINWAHLNMEDQALSGALDGTHDFVRFNPSAGVSYSPLPELTVFANYSEGNRAPTTAELACADPNAPCRLPNAFVADPPLEQVVTRGVELGLRGTVGAADKPLLRWSVAAFGSRNYEDILFVAGSRVGTGYFRNAGRTQRLGLEVDLAGEVGPVRYAFGYSLLAATFESDLTLPGAAHPLAERDEAAEDEEEETEGDDDDDDEGGTLDVSPGDRIPGLPTHVMNVNLAVLPWPRLEVGANVTCRSGVAYRGDEANLLGDLSGYAVLGAYARYQALDNLLFFVQGQNLLDTAFDTFGVIADPSEVLEGTSNPRFVSPGAPLAVFAGVEFTH